jgi:molybdenum cofactor cytidylyltransferase
LLAFGGETLIRRAVRAAAEAGCDPVIVIVGESSAAIRSELDIRDSRISFSRAQENETLKNEIPENKTPEKVTAEKETRAIVVENTEWRRGVGTSICRGLRQLPGSVDAVVLLACDQPFVDAVVVGKLTAAREETIRPIVASCYANTLGVPALFDRSCFEELLALPDDSGAKRLIGNRPNDVFSVAFEQGAIDIDTPEDFARLTAQSE